MLLENRIFAGGAKWLRRKIVPDPLNLTWLVPS